MPRSPAFRLACLLAWGAILLVRHLPPRRRQAPSLPPETLAGRSPEDAARIAAAWAGDGPSESVH